MVYNSVNADEIINRLDNDHNIDIQLELPRIPQWIYQALEKLGLLQSCEPNSYITYINNNIFELPTDLKYLIAIEYNGIKLSRRTYPSNKVFNNNKLALPVIYHEDMGITVTGNVESITYNTDYTEISANITNLKRYTYLTIQEIPEDKNNYYLLLNGKCETNIDSGYVVIYYYKLALGYNDKFGLTLPLVPDVEEVKEYIILYILKMYLQRGHKHNIYDLTSNNPYTNIGIALDKAYKPAINKANSWDNDRYNQVMKAWNASLWEKLCNIE